MNIADYGLSVYNGAHPGRPKWKSRLKLAAVCPSHFRVSDGRLNSIHFSNSEV